MSYKQVTKTGKPVWVFSSMVWWWGTSSNDMIYTHHRSQPNWTYMGDFILLRKQHRLSWQLVWANSPKFVLGWPLCSACTVLFLKKHNLHVYCIHLFIVIMHFYWLCECMSFCAVANWQVLTPFFAWTPGNWYWVAQSIEKIVFQSTCCFPYGGL